ncbi:uncharacterized protein LOC123551620 [Mercenaria mercenaria]|uniref:uncharacterized protein LOC123551620 n=1 Tax=Mercenaria mercenaria TaxID=6596 RepID=UPI00234F6F59|nr:uncharacterized protein LOC123551620 [Mercenaria mercenaria]
MAIKRSKLSAAKTLPAKKLYRICLAAFWVIVAFAFLHNLSMATMYTLVTKIKMKSFRDMEVHDNKFFHVDSNNDYQNSDTFVSLIDNSVHIYSAIAYNSTEQYVFDSIYLSGWENRMWSRFYKPNFTCCLIYGKKNNDIMATRVSERHNWYYVGKAKLEVKQYVCPNVLRGHNRVPVAISLGIDKQCPKNHSKYIKIDYPQRQAEGRIAVCAKLVYENISASAMIEWFEYQVMMNVSKILLYTNNLNADAMSVLRYYKSVGICEYLPFTTPPIDDNVRGVGIKNFQGWNDEQVPVYDCQGKLSGYTFVGLYDVDEYVYAPEGQSLTHILNSLIENHPNAAGFTFKTEIYATTWGQDNSTDAIRDLTIGSYTMRTEAYRDRVKSIVRTDRLVPGRMSTHGYWARKPFRKPVIDESFATLKHYRTCRKEWLRKGGDKCYKTIEKIKDTSMLQIAANIKQRVSEVKHKLGIT